MGAAGSPSGVATAKLTAVRSIYSAEIFRRSPARKTIQQDLFHALAPVIMLNPMSALVEESEKLNAWLCGQGANELIRKP